MWRWTSWGLALLWALLTVGSILGAVIAWRAERHRLIHRPLFPLPVYIATTRPVNLHRPPLTVGGEVLMRGHRVLVKDQTIPGENGIYVVQNPDRWTRTDDLLVNGSWIWVSTPGRWWMTRRLVDPVGQRFLSAPQQLLGAPPKSVIPWVWQSGAWQPMGDWDQTQMGQALSPPSEPGVYWCRVGDKATYCWLRVHVLAPGKYVSEHTGVTQGLSAPPMNDQLQAVTPVSLPVRWIKTLI